MANAPVNELVLSPRWTVTVGNIDGTPHVLLRIHHPRLGPLDFLLPNNDAIDFAAALEKTWERRDAVRMRRARPQSDEHVQTIRAGRPAHRRWWSWLFRSEPVVTAKFIATDAVAEKRRSKGSDKKPL
jgi:hypothetical protein